MNRKIVFGALAMLFIVLQSACSKDDKTTGEVNNNFLQVKIDGKDKSFSNVIARWVDGGNYLEITGIDPGKESISISVLSDATRVPAGQYGLDDASQFKILSSYSLFNSNSQLNFAATRGTLAVEDAFTLNIEKLNNSATEGTFSGVLVRAEGNTTLGLVRLTEGKFKAAIKAN